MYGPMTSFHPRCAPLYDRQQHSFLSAEQQSPQCHALYQHGNRTPCGLQGKKKNSSIHHPAYILGHGREGEEPRGVKWRGLD